MSASVPNVIGADALQPGQRVAHGRFEIVSRLGKGGGATVYRASVRGRETDVALKVLAAEHYGDSDLEQRFENEARIARSLSDVEGVVRVVEQGTLAELDERPFIALGFIRGPSLASTLIKEPLPVREAVGLVARLARTVAALHERGVVHRDIKPSNIVVARSNGVPCLIDFGVAHGDWRGAAAGASGLTKDYQRPGTKEYMAPEQVVGLGVHPSFDVFAVAGVLYEALVGRRPLFGLTASETARHKCDAARAEISIAGKREGLPEALVGLIDAGLRRDPNKRVASARVFAEGLEGWLRGEAERTAEDGACQPRVGYVAAAVVEKTEPLVAPGPEPVVAESGAGSRRWMVWGALAAAVAAVVVVMSFDWGDGGVAVERTKQVRVGVASGGEEPGGAVESESGVEAVAADEVTEAFDVGGTSGGSPSTGPVESGSTGGPAETEGTDEGAVAAPRVRPIGKHKPTPTPPTPPSGPAWSSAACEAVREGASDDRKGLRWTKVLRSVTAERKCWQSGAVRLELHVAALAGLGRYEQCVKTAAQSNSPRVSRTARQCQHKLEQNKVEQ